VVLHWRRAYCVVYRLAHGWNAGGTCFEGKSNAVFARRIELRNANYEGKMKKGINPEYRTLRTSGLEIDA